MGVFAIIYLEFVLLGAILYGFENEERLITFERRTWSRIKNRISKHSRE